MMKKAKVNASRYLSGDAKAALTSASVWGREDGMITGYPTIRHWMQKALLTTHADFFFRRPPFFFPPFFFAFAAISSTASSSVIDSGSLPFGIVAFVRLCLT